jgi:hypothetical protein
LENIKKLGVKNWWTVARDGNAWKEIVPEDKAHNGL